MLGDQLRRQIVIQFAGQHGRSGFPRAVGLVRHASLCALERHLGLVRRTPLLTRKRRLGLAEDATAVYLAIEARFFGEIDTVAVLRSQIAVAKLDARLGGGALPLFPDDLVFLPGADQQGCAEGFKTCLLYTS